jgi:hypothetical protein
LNARKFLGSEPVVHNNWLQQTAFSGFRRVEALDVLISDLKLAGEHWQFTAESSHDLGCRRMSTMRRRPISENASVWGFLQQRWDRCYRPKADVEQEETPARSRGSVG